MSNAWCEREIARSGTAGAGSHSRDRIERGVMFGMSKITGFAIRCACVSVTRCTKRGSRPDAANCCHDSFASRTAALMIDAYAGSASASVDSTRAIRLSPSASIAVDACSGVSLPCDWRSAICVTMLRFASARSASSQRAGTDFRSRFATFLSSFDSDFGPNPSRSTRSAARFTAFTSSSAERSFVTSNAGTWTFDCASRRTAARAAEMSPRVSASWSVVYRGRVRSGVIVVSVSAMTCCAVGRATCFRFAVNDGSATRARNDSIAPDPGFWRFQSASNRNVSNPAACAERRDNRTAWCSSAVLKRDALSRAASSSAWIDSGV